MLLYINEQKVSSFSQAAVLDDEYVLKHKTVFQSASEKPRIPATQGAQPKMLTKRDEGECYYCHRPHCQVPHSKKKGTE